tara:strand:- start:75413 stop:77155 length:1743 start_codon:yes stop_codon:yes gene_type:complete
MTKKIVLSLIGFVLIVAFQNCDQKGFGVATPPVDGSSILGLPQSDPLFSYAWHLNNKGQSIFASSGGVSGMDMNLLKTWNSGVYGKGITVQVSDDGVEYSHDDLSGNYNLSGGSRDYFNTVWASTNAPPTDSDFHGTSVAGLIAAIGGNGLGSTGVAPEAKLIATNFMSDEVSKTSDVIADQPKGDVDVVNMSWGYPQSNYYSVDPSFEDQLKEGVSNGRNGKGKIYVKSSGNSRVEEITRGVNDYRLGFSVFDDYSNTPYTIIVGGYLATGIVTNYSSPGSNLWVSSAGGYDGVKAPAMVTTDRKGCALGYANSALTGNSGNIGSGFQKGNNGNTGCNYTVQFNGTSSAAPTTAGAVALLLSAYPKLNWRDVKYILAKTAKEAALDFDNTDNYLYSLNHTTYLSQKSPAGYKWDEDWVTNAAGFRFSNYYGFGKIDVDKAVEFASTYKSLFTSPLIEASQSVTGLSISVPDFSSTGATSTIEFSQDITIEAIQITPDVTHANAGELAVELISPRGLRSVVVPMNNSLDKTANIRSMRFLTNAFYQESSVGTWTMKVVDGRSGTAGTINGWKINVIGQAK